MPIKLISICKDIVPYLVISIFVFFVVDCVLRNISDVYMLLILKILFSSALYILILLLLKSTILKEAISYLKR